MQTATQLWLTTLIASGLATILWCCWLPSEGKPPALRILQFVGYLALVPAAYFFFTTLQTVALK